MAKYYIYTEDGSIKSRSSLIKWFIINGNHSTDGWESSDEWIHDMIRNGLLIET